MVEITPEIQAQLNEQKKDCIFCKIVSGEMGSSTVYSDKHIKVVLDINPGVKVHMLVLPKEHYPIIPYLRKQDYPLIQNQAYILIYNPWFLMEAHLVI